MTSRSWTPARAPSETTYTGTVLLLVRRDAPTSIDASGGGLTCRHQLDNLLVTGLSHSADLRTIAKCSLSDEDTVKSLAVGLRPTEALVVGRITNQFPLVVEIDDLPAGWPATGVTRSFWDGPQAGKGRASRRRGRR
jgi:hypothetical protein